MEEEEFDIYGDLSSASGDDQNTLKDFGSQSKLPEECQKCKEYDHELSQCKTKSCTLERQFSSLMLTARSEVERKNKVIQDLRLQLRDMTRELDDMKFRRHRRVQVVVQNGMQPRKPQTTPQPKTETPQVPTPPPTIDPAPIAEPQHAEIRNSIDYNKIYETELKRETEDPEQKYQPRNGETLYTKRQREKILRLIEQEKEAKMKKLVEEKEKELKEQEKIKKEGEIPVVKKEDQVEKPKVEKNVTQVNKEEGQKEKESKMNKLVEEKETKLKDQVPMKKEQKIPVEKKEDGVEKPKAEKNVTQVEKEEGVKEKEAKMNKLVEEKEKKLKDQVAMKKEQVIRVVKKEEGETEKARHDWKEGRREKERNTRHLEEKWNERKEESRQQRSRGERQRSEERRRHDEHRAEKHRSEERRKSSEAARRGEGKATSDRSQRRGEERRPRFEERRRCVSQRPPQDRRHSRKWDNARLGVRRDQDRRYQQATFRRQRRPPPLKVDRSKKQETQKVSTKPSKELEELEKEKLMLQKDLEALDQVEAAAPVERAHTLAQAEAAAPVEQAYVLAQVLISKRPWRHKHDGNLNGIADPRLCGPHWKDSVYDGIWGENLDAVANSSSSRKERKKSTSEADISDHLESNRDVKNSDKITKENDANVEQQHLDGISEVKENRGLKLDAVADSSSPRKERKRKRSEADISDHLENNRNVENPKIITKEKDASVEQNLDEISEVKENGDLKLDPEAELKTESPILSSEKVVEKISRRVQKPRARTVVIARKMEENTVQVTKKIGVVVNSNIAKSNVVIGRKRRKIQLGDYVTCYNIKGNNNPSENIS